jgi:hypothetical protein
MNNFIRRIEVTDHSLAPAAAEVWITVAPERLTPTTEVRGRLMGPRCAYANTVEVAYPLLPLARPLEDRPGLTRRVLIPEASLWEPESPFLYQGPVELWQEGRKCDQITMTHGLRQMALLSKGLRINGRPLTLRGREIERCTEDEAMTLRREGINFLVTPVRAGTAELWALADRLGFFVLGRIQEMGEDTLERIAALESHPSCFGWLLKDPSQFRHAAPATRALLGLEASAITTESLPSDVRFVALPEKEAPQTAFRVPILLIGSASNPSPAGVILGTVAQ